MLVKCVLLILIMMVLPVSADESSEFSGSTDNNTFLDEHFIQDSVLVMASGAVYSAIMETLCYIDTLPHNQRAVFCKVFAAESPVFVYLVKTQKAGNSLEIWDFLNFFLVIMASGYIGATEPRPGSAKCIIASTVCYRVSRVSANSVVHYLWQSIPKKQEDIIFIHTIINGISTGLLINGMVLWHKGHLRAGSKLLILTLIPSGFAFFSIVIYWVFTETEGFNIKVAAAVAVAAATATEVEALAVALVVTGAGAGAIAIAGAGAGAAAAVVAAGVAGTGAIVGFRVISMTRHMVKRLSNNQQANRISKNLALVAVSGLPLLMSSWMVSLDQFLTANITAHETMQAVYPLNMVKAVFDSWEERLYHWLWLSD